MTFLRTNDRNNPVWAIISVRIARTRISIKRYIDSNFKISLVYSREKRGTREQKIGTKNFPEKEKAPKRARPSPELLLSEMKAADGNGGNAWL